MYTSCLSSCQTTQDLGSYKLFQKEIIAYNIPYAVTYDLLYASICHAYG